MPKKKYDDTDLVFDETYTLPVGLKRIPSAHIKALNAKGLKRCSACHSVKKLEEFSANASRPDGLQRECKQCDAAAQRAKTEAKYQALGRPTLTKAKSKKYVKHPKPHRADDYALIVPELIEAARANGHPAFDNPELRNTEAAKEVLVERPDLVVWCVDLGTWSPATNANMIVGWPRGNAKPFLKAHSRIADTARQAQRTQEVKARNAAGKPVTPDHKWCPCCAQTLPSSAFGVSRQTTDGLNTRCTSCNNARTSTRRAEVARKTPPGMRGISEKAWRFLEHQKAVLACLFDKTTNDYNVDHVFPIIPKDGELDVMSHRPEWFRLMDTRENIAKSNSQPSDDYVQETIANWDAAYFDRVDDDGELGWSLGDGWLSGFGEIEMSDLYDDESL